MRCFTIVLLAIAASTAVPAQQKTDLSRPAATVATASEDPGLSFDKLGTEDLIAISVYDSPELTRNVRVEPDGKIRLPMVRQRIQAAGLSPSELESAIGNALVDENVMVNPVVTVTVVEYHSRPITIVGAVRSPTTIQASGTVTLLDAIIRAGGITEGAGSDILVTHPGSSIGGASINLTDRIPVQSLMDASSPAANTKLEGGEIIRVPAAGQVFVAGNVKHPGEYTITGSTDSSVLKALAFAGGLDSYSSHTAYIYRLDDSTGRTNEIPIQIKKIIARKSPDVPLLGNDMLYVSSAAGQRISAKTLEITLGAGLGMAGLLLYLTH